MNSRQESEILGNNESKFWSIRDKTVWDLLQLLITPLFIAILASGLTAWFNNQENNRSEALEARRIAEQRSIEADRANQVTLENFYTTMKEFLLEEDLRNSQENSEVRSIARAMTLSTLRSLDGDRKGLLIKFLFESKLITNWCQSEAVIIGLAGADLENANLTGSGLYCVDFDGANLYNANLSDTYLEGATFYGANLSNVEAIESNLILSTLDQAKLESADLSRADISSSNLVGAELQGTNLTGASLIQSDLSYADLTGADLTGAKLQGTILTKATVTNEQLAQAEILGGAILPNGEEYDPNIHTEIAELRIIIWGEP